jgi:3-hydroxyisobutyrate dehydrogenase-like beta-hydroxyacid dehydrogenase
MIVALIVGQMGAGVAASLTARGIAIRTSLAGRTGASAARAGAAGALACCDTEVLVGADLFLSIVPPGSAIQLAERFAPHLGILYLSATRIRRNVRCSSMR